MPDQLSSPDHRPPPPNQPPPDVEVLWQAQPGSQQLFLSCPVPEILYHGTRGPGKRLNNNTTCLTDSGWKRVGDVTMEDRLVSVDGSYTDIIGIFPGASGTMYRITFDDGASVEVDGDHLWLARSGKNGSNDGWLVRNTAKLLHYFQRNVGKKRHERNDWYIPTMSAPAPGPQWSGLDPYAIGLMLGDGTTGSKYATIYSIDDYCLDYMAVNHGWRIYRYSGHCPRVAETKLAQSEAWKDATGRCKGADKRVDAQLLHADPTARLAVLQGLMDSDGSVDTAGRCRFVSLSEQLAHDVQYLTRSLGGKAHCYWEKRPSLKGGVDGRWRVNVQHCNKFNPFRLPRKAARVKRMLGVNRRITSIERVDDAEATCFTVAHPSQLFVVQDFIVTHNTDALLFKFARYVGRGYGSWWRGVLFRRTYKQLDEIIVKTNRWFAPLFPNARFVGGEQMKWRWDTGEELLLRHFDHPDDYWNYHGHEYPFVAWEELTSWPSLDCYEIMKACWRSSCPDPTLPRFYVSTSNPYGPGHNAVKLFWIDAAPTNRVIRDEKSGTPRVHIHGSVYENKALMKAQPEYVKQLESITDKARRAAWLEGSWDITSGGMFDDIWDANVHLIAPFQIPSHWFIDRSFDWGSSRPFSVCWWAQSDGGPVRLANGTLRTFPRNTLFYIHEWYGWNGQPNAGSHMLATDIATGIVAKEQRMGIFDRANAGPADSSIWDQVNGMCIAHDMSSKGVDWLPANKGPGSRRNGWELIRIRLSNAIAGEDPGLYVFERGLLPHVADARLRQFGDCTQFRRTFPSLPRDPKDPDDVDTTAEDHIGDAVRYRILAAPDLVGQRKFGETQQVAAAQPTPPYLNR